MDDDAGCCERCGCDQHVDVYGTRLCYCDVCDDQFEKKKIHQSLLVENKKPPSNAGGKWNHNRAAAATASSSEEKKEQGRTILYNDDDGHDDRFVVELALQKYECYHSMKRGTATYEMVYKTAAGILGWANSSIGDIDIANIYAEQSSGDDPNNPRLRPYWCQICSCDCQNSKEYAGHIRGSKHEMKERELDILNKNEKDSTTSVISSTSITKEGFPVAADVTSTRFFWCNICNKYFCGKEAIQYHKEFDDEHYENMTYQLKGVDFVDEGLKKAATAGEPTKAAAKAATATTTQQQQQQQQHTWYDEDDSDMELVPLQKTTGSGDHYFDDNPNEVDYSKFHDTDRMLQTDYDDVVVELALYKYESYLGMERGTATYAMVNSTPDGILGWASSTVGDVVDINTNYVDEHDEQNDCKPAAVASAPVTVPVAAGETKGNNEHEQQDRKPAAMIAPSTDCSNAPVVNDEHEQDDCKPAAAVTAPSSAKADSTAPSSAKADSNAPPVVSE